MPSIGELREIGTDPGLDGKVVLITGASRGIGETTAKLVALCGAKVIVNYHRGAADADRVVREIEESGGSALAVGADVTNEGDVRALVERSVERFGAVDVLVNNAVRDFRPIPFAQLTWDEVQRDLDVIAKGAFLCCQHVIPAMIAQGGGKIINIASVATDNPPPDQTKYVMAKSALVGLTRSLAVELASKNIQVNMVVPSFVETDLVAHVQEGFRNKIARETPMGRNASPVDVARAVLFLASSWSSFTTGQKLMVTGGGAPYL
jgi:3-oxoacyl-[acyl-carrier protein] reductase